MNATTVLRLAPDNMEALFRRGLARTEMQQWNQARQGKKTTNFFETNLMNFLDIQAFLDGGGCSVKGRAVLDAITHYEEFSIPEPISDKSNDGDELFENFPPEDVPGLEIRDSKVNGKGVFATREFKSGEIILREKPLLTTPPAARRSQPAHVETALRGMSPENMARFLSMYNAHTGDCCSDLPSPLVFDIYDSNMIALPERHLYGEPYHEHALCFYASRFNHSCAPKTAYYFDSVGEFRLYAVDPIHEGEEIFRLYSYGSSQEMHCATRAWRQDELRKLFHFTCVCALCTLPDTAAQASDARRVRVGEIMDNIRTISNLDDMVAVLPALVDGARMAREEGDTLFIPAFVFMTGAMYVCALHSDQASVEYWEELIYSIMHQHMGDTERAQEKCEELFESMSENVTAVGLQPHKDFSQFRMDD